MGVFIIYTFCFLVFLFSVFALSKDDYIFLRKNISTEALYNIVFLAGIIGLIFSKLTYILFHFQSKFLNPLNILFSSSQSFSLTGGVVGAVVFILFLGKSKKLPSERIMDIFLVSLFVCLSFAFLFNVIIFEKTLSSLWLLIPALYAMFSVILIRILQKGNLKEGTVALLSLFAFSIISLLADIFEKMKKASLFLSLEDAVIIFLLFASLFLIVKRERLLEDIKKIKK